MTRRPKANPMMTETRHGETRTTADYLKVHENRVAFERMCQRVLRAGNWLYTSKRHGQRAVMAELTGMAFC